MKKGIGIIIGAIIAGAGIFGLAGNLVWWNAWLLIALMVLIFVFTQKAIKNTPGLAEERKTAAAKSKSWDLKLVKLLTMALPSMLIVAAFDMRFKWFPPVPATVSIFAFLTMILAAVLTYHSITANQFFSSHARIQMDRGQIVVSTGPYRLIRHPGYAGSTLFNLLVPLALGSWATLVLGIGTAVLLIYRTAKEDQMLMEELPGYRIYAEQVRNRLFPGIW